MSTESDYNYDYDKYSVALKPETELAQQVQKLVKQDQRSKSDVIRDLLDEAINGGDGESTDRTDTPREMVEVEMSKFAARVVGNRLWEKGESFAQMGEEHLEQETKHLARIFHDKGRTRDESEEWEE
jgi:hypothetical protein